MEMIRPPLFQVFEGGLRGDKDAADVQIDHVLQLFQGGFLERLGDGGAGVVDKNIEPAQHGGSLLNGGDHGLGAGAVRLDGDGFPAELLNMFDNSSRRLGALGVGDGDVGAFGRQTPGDGGADAA